MKVIAPCARLERHVVGDERSAFGVRILDTGVHHLDVGRNGEASSFLPERVERCVGPDHDPVGTVHALPGEGSELQACDASAHIRLDVELDVAHPRRPEQSLAALDPPV